MGHGDVLNVIRCTDSRRVMKEALEAGWVWVGYTKSGHVEIRWPLTDTVIHCATTPSDRNAWKAFARNVKAVSGVDVERKGNHRRSRKSTRVQVDPQVEASRRRHAAAHEAEVAQREAAEVARKRAVVAADRAAASDRQRREIESLMMPRYGR